MVDMIDASAPALSATSDAALTPPTPPPVSASASAADAAAGRATLETPPAFQAKEPPQETVAEAPAADVPPAKPEATDPPAKTDDKPADPPATDPKPDPKGVAKRLAELTAQREAQTRLAELERERAETALKTAADLQKRLDDLTKAAPVAPTPRPDRTAFDTPESYDAALISWSAAEAVRTATAAQEARAAAEAKATADAAAETARKAEETAQVTRDREMATKWQERRAAAIVEMPDFEAVAESDAVQITGVMTQAIIEADNGPKVAYYLGKNPAEAARIAALPPGRQIFEMGKIDAKVSVTPPPPVSKAPAPIKPLGSNAAARPKPPAEMSMDEYAAHRKSAIAPRGSFLPDGRGATK